MHLRPRLAPVLVVVALVIGACSDDGAPSESTTSTTPDPATTTTTGVVAPGSETEDAAFVAFAASLEATDIGPGWAEDVDGARPNQPGPCNPADTGSLASTQVQSFDDGESQAAATEDVDAAMVATTALVVRTTVFGDAGAASGHVAALLGVDWSSCLDTDPSRIDRRDAGPQADEGGIVVVDQRPPDQDQGTVIVLSVVRTGRAVSVVSSLTFDGEPALDLVARTNRLLDQRIRAVL